MQVNTKKSALKVDTAVNKKKSAFRVNDKTKNNSDINRSFFKAS